jgi:hypothetical protein
MNSIPKFDAGLFVATIRRDQRASGKSLMGRPSLTQDTLSAIRLTAKHLLNVAPDGIVTSEDAEFLAVRFEEMCRRQKRHVDSQHRPAILQHLVTDLLVNCTATGSTPRQLVSVTLYWGGICPSLPGEFAEFGDTPWIFKHAAINNAWDPRGLLCKVRADIGAMSGEHEFGVFADTPGIIKYAVLNNPADPRDLLRRVQADIVALPLEAEFRNFHNTPWIFKYAATHNPNESRDFLRRAQKGEVRWIEKTGEMLTC